MAEHSNTSGHINEHRAPKGRPWYKPLHGLLLRLGPGAEGSCGFVHGDAAGTWEWGRSCVTGPGVRAEGQDQSLG
eukprot:CAMPEP_0174367728 /NCGR_PEP_ID=MMETSP0811_2-20130205/86456_1 /TAXON_ID=73025 ORGANISM="Eutreptiella gymnastica-like, Strain CCMP1594" /NCGR_SAMPLE_ID=MMETSP0811_2 /ASSEMBLY_ACC=CAM_ASM_000667 /LENGTH=74 /DNA_ID=CAMNT_0015510583 /DNA_START=222 /DNA_END=442 /DNA_ORIENTATION=-